VHLNKNVRKWILFFKSPPGKALENKFTIKVLLYAKSGILLPDHIQRTTGFKPVDL
jgi:hypothetical protein